MIQKNKPFIFRSPLLVIVIARQILPRLTDCLDNGLRTSSPSLRANSTPLLLLPGLSEILLKLPSGYEDMTR